MRHLISEGVAPRIIFDKSVAVKQLSVVEPHGLLIMRTDKGNDNRYSVKSSGISIQLINQLIQLKHCH